MSFLKNLFFALVSILLVAGCDNEPYEQPYLGVSTVTAGTSTSRYTYRYSGLETFSRITATDTTSMKFYYTEEGQWIVSDSTEESYKLTVVHNWISHPIIDSTFLITPTTRTLIQARTYTTDTFDELGNITAINVWDIEGTGFTQTIYELEWQNLNVTTITKKVIVPLSSQPETVLRIAYDDNPGAYAGAIAGGSAYFYTLNPEELYWLSANNPTSLSNDEFGDVFLSYTFNKFDLPQQIRTDRGLHIGHSYVDLSGYEGNH